MTVVSVPSGLGITVCLVIMLIGISPIPSIGITPVIDINIATPDGDDTISVVYAIPSILVPVTVMPMLSVGDVGPCSIAVMKSIIACSSATSVRHASEFDALSS